MWHIIVQGETTMDTIKTCRQSRKISQQTLADALGVARSTVAMWETGASEPDRDMILQLASYFDVSTDYLLGHETEYSAPSDDAIKFALFGGGGEITDAMYDEVKQFAKMVRMREEQSRTHSGDKSAK